MKNFLISAGTAALTAVIVVALFLSGHQPSVSSPTLGGTETVLMWLGGGVRTGTGNPVTNVLENTCNAAIATLPLAATSTQNATCTVTGARTGDKVFVSLPRIGIAAGAFLVTHAVASTDTITFGILNLTGAATSSFAQATTSVMYRVSRSRAY